ncbi:uncharacterized protein C3orf14 homolog [Periophthalmus magnuspinnatus]|uniref:uncharacterized protein C3orf14 homolog n=1 Tax=Periophthalmus magnuspinnatus TaxID=409849 RepID=UPI0024363AAE|nr:uncharacterized protein C3orf14 homolog [Periophthalmus magnuspinnatus]
MSTQRLRETQRTLLTLTMMKTGELLSAFSDEQMEKEADGDHNNQVQTKTEAQLHKTQVYSSNRQPVIGPETSAAAHNGNMSFTKTRWSLQMFNLISQKFNIQPRLMLHFRVKQRGFAVLAVTKSRLDFSGNEDDFSPLRLMELAIKYEQIIQRRRSLLEQMEERRLKLRDHRLQHRERSEAAHRRNQALLQELENMEHSLREAQRPSSEEQDLESRYWASVEESVPAWEHFLLEKGLHRLTDAQPTMGAKHKRRKTKDTGLPPLPSPVSQSSSSKKKMLTAVGRAG